jgi:branched-chain amino acid transport system permease protein
MRAAARFTLLRSLALVGLTGLILFLITETVSDYRSSQIATGAYFFAVLAGLTVLAGVGGRISLGHGAFMSVGAYAALLLIGKENWALAPALAAAAAAAAVVGFPVGLATTRLEGPYLAGATLAFAIGLPALGDKFSGLFGGENGLAVNPPTPPSWLGTDFSLFRWEAWIACLGALIVLFVLYNLVHSWLGRSLRAARDDAIAASLCGLGVSRLQTTAFVISAACAGLGGAVLGAVVQQLATPSAFGITLSLYLLAGVVVGGLGSLAGAIWGAALLVLLPNWSNDLANSFSLSTNVKNNLPLAIYGAALIGLMLVWPGGIQGGLNAGWRAIFARARGRRREGAAPAAAESAGDQVATHHSA